MIKLFHVYKSYGGDVSALCDLTLEIERGEFVFVTGPSGAGKSTLLRLIFHAASPNAGQLIVCGRNTARLARADVALLRRKLGVVFQDFKLLGRRNVYDNVALALEVLGLPHRVIRRRVFEVLKEVSLAHKMHHLVQRLAGGEQQRVALARALVGEPQILLADEPTGNLDAERAMEVMALLCRAHARGTTVLVATHDRALLARHRGRLLGLQHGRLVHDVRPSHSHQEAAS
ncbi:MAG: cell division ATP-binding protein FtsE [Acetobacteraceae bacterium]|nr:MAG: cell division ATP-binding protein FtsE [Acetobacteraceae bacterium]